MNKSRIKQVIERVFNRSGEFIIPVQVKRVLEQSHIPGGEPEVSEMTYSARLFPMTARRTRSAMEEGPVLDKAVQLALLLMENEMPAPGDILQIGADEFAINQVASMDHGSGFLFEVWYQ
ncbi:hypothetical protein [Sneathiella glossodoripedis]|uniref:hypothetical protein n=1 Tax=Sneathiella glossodoripedis TaxID=418853 RepID=UPI0004725E1E|nr:hypothetical protein [Sneathiella glossodoripedis]